MSLKRKIMVLFALCFLLVLYVFLVTDYRYYYCLFFGKEKSQAIEEDGMPAFGNAQKYFLTTGYTIIDVLRAKDQSVVVLYKSKKHFSLSYRAMINQNKQLSHLNIMGKKQRPSMMFKKQPPIIYLVPHQDDEVLTFGIDIRNELSQGRNVHVVLMTYGEDTTTRDIINGVTDNETMPFSFIHRKTFCTWHMRYHNPTKERYPDGHLTKEKFSAIRTKEYERASLQLGISKDHIHRFQIPVKKSFNSNIFKEQVRDGIRLYLKRYPNAEFGTMSPFDGQSVHALIGQTVKDMQMSGELKGKQARYLVSIFTDRFYGRRLPVYPIKETLDNPSDILYLDKAIYEYTHFDPKDGYYAVGYHSVRAQFDSLLAHPYTKFYSY